MASWVLLINRQINWPKLDFAGGLAKIDPRSAIFNMVAWDGQDLLAIKRGVTLCSLTEEGLRKVIEESSGKSKYQAKPVTFKGTF